LSDKVAKGIKNPGLAASHLYRRSKEAVVRFKLELYRRQRDIQRQRHLINEFASQDELILVILDACRYDVFEEVYSDYVNGELSRVWSSGRWTADYVRRTWDDSHDLTYLSSIPVVSDFYFELRGYEFRPSNYFDEVVPLWDRKWDPELGTVPADKVTDTALAYSAQTDRTRLVAHYAQPHAPYVGDNMILPWDPEEDEYDLQELLEKDIDRPSQRIYDRIKSGELPDCDLWQAYRDNLRYVLEEVVRLVRRADCPVVVTADHGEHLGEDEKYLHEEESCLIRQVPWFIVSDSEIGTVPVEDEYESLDLASNSQNQTSDKVKERLADLGYVDGRSNRISYF
jgi:hypothetical protein